MQDDRSWHGCTLQVFPQQTYRARLGRSLTMTHALGGEVSGLSE